MAENLISPGVLARENDQSQITAQPIQAGAAIVGPTVKGRVNIPTLITSYSQYKAKYGSTFTSASNEYTYLTSISAYNYFNNGGTSLLVARVASGSFLPATSDNIQSAVKSGVLSTTTNELLSSFTSVSASAGSYTTLGSTGSLSGTGAKISVTLDTTSSISTVTVTTAGSGYVVGETLTIASASLGSSPSGANLIFTLLANDIVNSSAFTLETFAEGIIQNSVGPTGSNGTLDSGSVDNLRWEIVSPNTSSGTFGLLVRRGNDNKNQKIVLESFNDLSLDPQQDNYISKVIGDSSNQVVTDADNTTFVQPTGSFPNSSNYVRVKSIVLKTLKYFNNAGVAKNSYTSSIPLAGSGSFSGATGTILTGTGNYYQKITSTDTQGLKTGNYTTALALLNNKDEYKYNLLTAPGITYADYPTQVTTMITQAQTRGDYIAVIDLKLYNNTVNGVINQASGIDNSYAATYWPWVQTTDPDSGELVWVPASTLIPGVYAYNDRVAASWFAPAGVNRGGMSTVTRAERKLTQTNRDNLYAANINPIGTFPNTGVVVFGQKTLQKKKSALDRVNVRRLLITLKNFISQIADTLVFEQNSRSTRFSFLAQVNPYLEAVQQQQGLYAFKVVMDDSNNTADVIDRNELVGQIYLQPTRTAEFIILDFNVMPTGATFPI